MFSLVPDLFQPILAWNEAVTLFFNFLNFYAVFLKFSITRRVGIERNHDFYFLSFSAFSDLLWLEIKPLRYFLIFKIFYAIFLKFSIKRRAGTEWNDNFFFLSFPAFSDLLWLEIKPSRYFLVFWIFLLFFWNFLLRVGL